MQIKSITVNSVLGKETKKKVAELLNKPLITIYGFAYTTFVNESKYGENTGFKGDFVAVNLITGEVFESNAAFLPKNLTQQIEAMMTKAQGLEVEFKAQIMAVPSEVSPNGYAWIADAPTTEERKNRAVAMLEKIKKDTAGLLAAPSKTKKAA